MITSTAITAHLEGTAAPTPSVVNDQADILGAPSSRGANAQQLDRESTYARRDDPNAASCECVRDPASTRERSRSG